MQVLQRLRAATLSVAALCAAAPAMAQVPHNWQLGFQAAHSPVQEAVEGLHSMILWMMATVTIFVALLLLYVAWRFNAKKNPAASRVSHHTALEVAWTVLPVLILVVIAIPSFRVVYFEDRTEAADLTIKVTGHRWFWEYTYPDQGDLTFTSYMVKAENLKAGQLRNLDVDNRVVVPAGRNVRILTTSADVIHSFYIPSLGVQRYAIPGRTIETWVRVDKPGVYYGQCNQICGNDHSGMPIAVEALSDEAFAAWVEQAKTRSASDEGPGQRRVAAVADTTR